MFHQQSAGSDGTSWYGAGHLAASGLSNGLHNYPFTGGLGFGCVPSSETGGFSIHQEVAGAQGASVTHFSGAWSCSAAGLSGASGSWGLAANGTWATDIGAGGAVTIATSPQAAVGVEPKCCYGNAFVPHSGAGPSIH